jgi:hypothetical protein
VIVGLVHGIGAIMPERARVSTHFLTDSERLSGPVFWACSPTLPAMLAQLDKGLQ